MLLHQDEECSNHSDVDHSGFFFYKSLYLVALGTCLISIMSCLHCLPYLTYLYVHMYLYSFVE